MKASIYYGKHDLRVEEVPIKKLKDDEVQIQVKYCGVCGTDVHIFNGDGGSSDVTPPLIPGHEFSGIVSEIGCDVTSIKVGDKVSVDPNDMCGECYFCKSGKQHFCINNIGIGTTVDGGFAEYVVVRAKQVYPISNKLSFIEAAMAEPLACCLHGIDLCNIEIGSTVLILGGGPIGMLMLQLAKSVGAAKVILSEPVLEKRELAATLGADKTINPLEEDLKAVLSNYAVNIDAVIECVGNVKIQKDAVHLAGKGATVMFFGLTGKDASFPLSPDEVFKKELNITSSYINPYTFERAIKVLESGMIDVERIVTNIIPLDNILDVFTKPEYRKSGKVFIKTS